MTLGERIKKVRKALDLTQQEFCDRIGLKRNSISLVESDKRNPSKQLFLAICREFNVNETWLRTGEGEMMKSSPANALERLAQEYHLSDSTRIMVEKFINLRPDIQKGIFNFICEIAEAASIDNTSESIETESDTTYNEMLEIFRQGKATKEAEDAYIKSRSGNVPQPEQSALNTTADTELGSANGNNPASNQ